MNLGEAMKFMAQVLQWEPWRVADSAESSPGAAEFVHGPGTPCSGLMLVSDLEKQQSPTLQISEASWDCPLFSTSTSN